MLLQTRKLFGVLQVLALVCLVDGLCFAQMAPAQRFRGPSYRPPRVPSYRPPTPTYRPPTPRPSTKIKIPTYTPPSPPRMRVNVPGPSYQKVWSCGRCGARAGTGTLAPFSCPSCGVRFRNGGTTRSGSRGPTPPRNNPVRVNNNPGGPVIHVNNLGNRNNPNNNAPNNGAPNTNNNNDDDDPAPRVHRKSSKSNKVPFIIGGVFGLIGMFAGIVTSVVSYVRR